VRDPFKGRVRVAAEPAHSTFPEQGSRSVLPQGEWHPQSRRLRTGHLRNAPSQGRARGQSCNRTCALPVTFPEQSSRSVVLQGEWRHGCALHLPKALLEVGVATGPDGPNRFWAARARRKGSTGRAVAGLVSRYCPRVPHPHPRRVKGSHKALSIAWCRRRGSPPGLSAGVGAIETATSEIPRAQVSTRQVKLVGRQCPERLAFFAVRVVGTLRQVSLSGPAQCLEAASVKPKRNPLGLSREWSLTFPPLLCFLCLLRKTSARSRWLVIAVV